MKRISNKDYIYFDTTSRNPLRLKHLLRIAKPYEGQVLTNDLCEEIVKDLIKYKFFKPDKSLKVLEITHPQLKLANKFKEVKEFTDKEAWLLINIWKPDHAEPGFRASKKDPHWAARWMTYYKECLVYGLIDYTPPGKGKDLDKFAKPFFITELGHMLIDSIPEDETADTKAETNNKEQIIFAHIMAKFISGNPIRRCSYNVSPLPLLLKTLLIMQEDPDVKKSYLGKDETVVLLTIRENDPYKLLEALKKFRKSIPIKKSNKTVIDKYIRKEIAESKGKDILSLWSKPSNMESARDALWRRFRATGLFLLDKSYSLSLDLNQKKLIEYIINNYLDAKTDKSSEDDYYSYVRSIDSNLLKYRQEPQFADQTKLEKIAGLLTWDEIKNELKNCDDPKKTDGTIGPIKEIKKSLRYEFIIAVAITKKFINTKVNSNCQTDSFGWPIGHAPGQINRNISGADIECFEESLNFIVEPSLGQSEAWQLKEGINLDAHLKRFIELEDKPAKGFFISPSIKERVKTLENFFAYESGEFIMRNFTTDDLISRLENEESLLSSFNNKT